MSWATFIKAHLGVIVGMDFFTVEVVTWLGLIRYHVLFAIDVASRKVEILGIAVDPGGPWMEQMARSLVDAVDGFLVGKRYVWSIGIRSTRKASAEYPDRRDPVFAQDAGDPTSRPNSAISLATAVDERPRLPPAEVRARRDCLQAYVLPGVCWPHSYEPFGLVRPLPCPGS